MAKKKTNEDIIETIIDAPILSESEQIVSGNAELEQLKKDIATSRAAFVDQTDKQIARIAELDVEIASKEAKSAELIDLIENVYPTERAKFIAIQNEASAKTGEAETRIADAIAREADLVKREAQVAKGKEENAKKSDELEAQSISIGNREKALNSAAKEIMAFKNAMSKI